MLALALISPDEKVDSTVVEHGKGKVECLLLFGTNVTGEG